MLIRCCSDWPLGEGVFHVVKGGGSLCMFYLNHNEMYCVVMLLYFVLTRLM